MFNEAVHLSPKENCRQRAIVCKTKGHRSGPITRLMSPSDFGQFLKPFVFLDLFDTKLSFIESFPVHPHSGIATLTVVTGGELRFDDPQNGRGVIGFGGLEWMQAGAGTWHGDEMSAGASESVQGFQLWIALPAALESTPPCAQFIEACHTPSSGPAHVMAGTYGGTTGEARSPEGITYLLVKLQPHELWTFDPSPDQTVAFVAVADGKLRAEKLITAGELAEFERNADSIELQAGEEGAVFVLGAAFPHPHELILGSYSVHTSQAALEAGEARIRATRPR
jgi:redox-sensitive bicupin YhaK (pirin superfamily)